MPLPFGGLGGGGLLTGKSNIDARNELLKKASLYYEFPLFSYDNPPSNDYVDFCLVHAFNRAGFEASTHTGPRRVDSQSGSRAQLPFDGVMRGSEFGKIINLAPWIMLMFLGIMIAVPNISFVLFDDDAIYVLGIVAGILLFILGLAMYIIQRRKLPMTASIVFWGVNCYQIMPVSKLVKEADDQGEYEVGDAANLVQWGSTFHPIRTILHVAVAFEPRPRTVQPMQAEQKFQLLKQKIGEELGVQPIPYQYSTQSMEINALPIFKWNKGGQTLKDLEQRFPL